MDVIEICTPDVVTVSAATTLQEAAVLMRERHVGTLVIVDDNREPTGILTDRDIVVGVLAGDTDHLRQLTVGDVVTRQVVCCSERDDILWAAWRMRDEGVRRLPVVDASDKLVGIVSLDDVLGAVVEQLDDLVGAIRGQPSRERARRA